MRPLYVRGFWYALGFLLGAITVGQSTVFAVVTGCLVGLLLGVSATKEDK